jgi:FixJ family two-component response regulator
MVRALTRLLRANEFDVRGFTCAAELLKACGKASPGCLVLDVAMPDLNGLTLQRRLTHAGILLPVVFLTGHGDIPMSVRAMKEGAVDFLTKPVKESDLVHAVTAALNLAAERKQTAAQSTRLALLTPREREVLEQLVMGKANKEVAAFLGTGEPNIKFHRGNIMRKIGVNSFAELVRLAERVGLGRGAPGEYGIAETTRPALMPAIAKAS